MRNFLLYVIAIILIIGWIAGFYVFHYGAVIHVLLVIAIVIIILRIIQGSKTV